MLEKNYHSPNAYGPENACDYIDALLALEKAFVPGIVVDIEDADKYVKGLLDGICIAISTFGEVNGVIPYSDECDEGLLDFAIENGVESLDEFCEKYMPDDDDDECCEDECQHDGECKCDDDPLITLGVDQETFDKLLSVLSIIAPSV